MRLARRSLLAAPLLALPALRAAEAQSAALRVSLTPSIFNAMFEDMIRGFEADPAAPRIRVEGRYRDQIDQFQATLRQGLVGGLTDAGFQGFAYLPELRERDITVRLDDFLARDEGAAALGLSGAVLSTSRVGEELHGLGVAMSFPIIYLNAVLMRRAGLDADQPPRDWDGILAAARAIDALKLDGVMGGAFQYASGGNWTWIALTESLGGRMVTPDGRRAFDDATGMRALEIIGALGATGQDRGDVAQDALRGVFRSGNIGILVDSSSSLVAFESSNGPRLEVRTAPLPVSAGGRLPAAGICSVMHVRDPARQQMAWRFMRYASGPEGQAAVARLTGYTPANAVAVAGPLAAHYAARPTSRAGLDSAAHAAPWFAFPGENSARIAPIIRDHLRQLVIQRSTPRATMDAIVASVRQLVPQLG